MKTTLEEKVKPTKERRGVKMKASTLQGRKMRDNEKNKGEIR